MLLPEDVAMQFIDLYQRVLYFAGKERGVLPARVSYRSFLDATMKVKANCRDALYEPPSLLPDFLASEGEQLSDEERQIVREWARGIYGTFVVLKHLKKHTIFLSTREEPNAYGVLGLTTELDAMFPNYVLPLPVIAALLPYMGVIVCDGLISAHNVIIGPGMRRNILDEYKEIKQTRGIVTIL